MLKIKCKKKMVSVEDLTVKLVFKHLIEATQAANKTLWR